MPPRKSVRAPATPGKTRKVGRRKKQDDDEVPQVFQEMLAEAASYSLLEPAQERAAKRRRTTQLPKPSSPVPEPHSPSDMSNFSPALSQTSQRPRQIVYEDFGSSEDESDVDFEDVAIGKHSEEAKDRPEQRPLQLNLSKTIPLPPTMQRRKPVSKAERDYRLNVHKTHLLLLLMNVQLRRFWCESEEVQAILKPLISSKLRNMLHVGNDKPDYQRNHSFNKAIEEICAIWRDEFEITGPGMRSACWREDIDVMRAADEFDDPSDYAEFQTAAGTRHGSRDLGAMLFCALLRSAAVETRLVCSLQVLPFSAVAKGQTPEKPKSEFAYSAAWPSREVPVPSHEDPSNARWRQSEYAGATAPVSRTRVPEKKIQDSPYPMFWVEVMLPITDRWIPLDPLVRKTINKPKTGFEPPLSDQLNSMSYVMAFEETGFAKDVTRRYAQFFNAKTRRQRVESTKHGDYWWSATIQWFTRLKPRRSKGDIEEDEELDKKSENEPMPKNLSDFKDHPVFALERHLRRNEVVWPTQHRGFISAGNKDGKSEKVYYRKNVHVVRSADQWYRRGRDLKMGEQPLKRVATSRRRVTPVDGDEEEQNQDGTLLYAEFQTDLYIPPPVVKGRIPKNQYGNLDVYVPSMIPPGAIHFQHPEARNAARILAIDFTDAVTGFKFKGRQGTAIVNGIVAAAEYRDALVEVVEALEYERVREQQEKQRMIALVMWKRFMAVLRVRQRIREEHAEHDNGEEDVASPAGEEDENSMYNGSEDEAGGGFMPEADEVVGDEGDIDAVDLAKLSLDPQQAIYHEVIVVESPHTIAQQAASMNRQRLPKSVPSLLPKDSLFDDDDAEDQLFNGGNDEEPGGFVRDDSEGIGSGGFVAEDDISASGGEFAPDEDEDLAGGGFILDDDTQNSGQPLLARETDVSESSGEKLEVSIPLVSDRNEPSNIQRDTTAAAAERMGICNSKGDDEDEKDDDHVSLLSHDPDDDDAEEAWAMDIDE